MNWRRLLPNVRYGTERYPEKVARRLRAVNITAWLAAAIAGFFASLRLLSFSPELWMRGIVNALAALGFAMLPLLHRISPVAAPLAFVVAAFAFNFRVASQVGTDGGTWLYYLSAAALGILFLGTEHLLLTAAIAIAGGAMIVFVHLTIPPNTGLLPPRSLFFGNFLTNVVMNALILFAVVYYAFRQQERAEESAEREYARSESLLGNILPPKVAARLKERDAATIADRYDAASILFADMAGFTARESDTAPDALVGFLDEVFTKLDALVERHGLEKIKTTGDAYMVVSGMPEPRADHAEALAALALDMRDALAGLVDPKGRAVPVRIGLASRPVVAGVVGRKKFFCDVWGDTVNTAARMEQTAEPGTIQVAPQTRDLLAERFDLEERGAVDIRGKGSMRTWLLLGKTKLEAQRAAEERIAPTMASR
jgi:adenylate cyclase